MTIKESFRGALRRLAGARVSDQRRTLALPSMLVPYGSRVEVLPKPTPANLRRFAETPIARKAINTVKDRVAGMKWRIQPKNGRALAELPQGAERVAILTDNLDAPNSDDSFRSLAEQILEDVIVGGFGAIELQLSGNPARPLLLYPVDGATIKMRPQWDGDAPSVRYAQATGRYGPEAYIELADEELSYIRLNPRTHTPFGLGRLEVAFETINAFLGAHRYAARLASNSVVQFALWLQDLTPAHHERLIRWWQDEIEGTGRVPILSAESKPEVLRFGQGTDADLRLSWQEFLLRVIAFVDREGGSFFHEWSALFVVPVERRARLLPLPAATSRSSRERGDLPASPIATASSPSSPATRMPVPTLTIPSSLYARSHDTGRLILSMRRSC